jgi:hypothetical protein
MKYVVLAFAVCFLVSCQPQTHEERSTHRLIYNNDGTEILANNWLGQRPLTLSDLHQYVDQVANSQVTTYMICSGSDFSYYRSRYGTLLGDPKNGTADCPGNPALGKALDRYYQNILTLEKEDTDIVAATLKRAKEKNLEAFVTYRVNDLHFSDTTQNCSQQYSDFWRANPQFWTSDTALRGWNAWNALDFAHPEVRNHKLGAIREQLIQYGPLLDGFELDFMRFIVYFKKHDAQKNAPLMTDFVRQAKGIADSVGRVYDKKILLTARVPASMKDCVAKGLDARTWAKEGLVDFLTMGVHWRGEPSMGVADFKKELGSDLPVYATLDDGTYNPREVYSHGMYRGMASHALAQGASGTTLFNYFLTVYNDAGQVLQPEEGTLACRTIAPELLQELGSLETLRKRNKIYCLSDGETSYELTPNSPLPLAVSSKEDVSLFVGDEVATDKPEEVILFVRTRDTTPYTVRVNGQAVSQAGADYPKLYDREKGLKDDQQVLAFLVPSASLKQGHNRITLEADSTPTHVLRIELALKYGQPEQFGYF